MNKQITVTFNLNEPQWESVKSLSQDWGQISFMDLYVRRDGQDYHYEADWIKEFLQQVEKERST